MPTFDQNRSPKLFIEAGSKAYRAGIRIKDNPYTNNNQRELWKKGWTRARTQERSHKEQYTPIFANPNSPRLQPSWICYACKNLTLCQFA
jgi:ribosome modulation factor